MPSKKQSQAKNDIVQICRNYWQERYHKHYHPEKNVHGTKHLIFDVAMVFIVFGLIASIIFIQIFYTRALIAERIAVDLRVVPQFIESGGKVSFEVQYENSNEDQVLHDARVNFAFPKGFVFRNSTIEPVEGEHNVFELGDIDIGQKGSIRVDGLILGAIDAQRHVSGSINYALADEGRLSQQVLFSQTVDIVGSVLSVEPQMPGELIDQQEFELSIFYENMSPDYDLDNISLYVFWPPAFEILGDKSEEIENEGFVIEHLNARESGVASVRARVDAQGDSEKTFIFQTIIEHEGERYIQKEEKITVPIRYPQVKLEQNLSQTSVSPGESVFVNVNIQNNEEFSVNNVQVATRFDSSVFEIVTSPGRVASIASGSNAQSQYELRVRNNAQTTNLASSARLISSEVSYVDATDESRAFRQFARASAIQFAAIPSVSGEARYFSASGEQLGRGPLPPQQGKTTRYWIFLESSTQYSGLSNAIVVAALPEYASWTGMANTNQGSMRYDQDTRTILWTLGSMELGKEYGAAFALDFDPANQTQTLLPVSLLEDVSIVGLDTNSGAERSSSSNDIKNDIIS